MATKYDPEDYAAGWMMGTLVGFGLGLVALGLLVVLKLYF